MDISSAGTKSGGLKQVFPLRIGFELYTFDNINGSQIKAQPRPAPQPQQPHKSCGRSEVPQPSISKSEIGIEHYLSLNSRSRHCGIHFKMHYHRHEHLFSHICERVRYPIQAHVLGHKSNLCLTQRIWRVWICVWSGFLCRHDTSGKHCIFPGYFPLEFNWMSTTGGEKALDGAMLRSFSIRNRWILGIGHAYKRRGEYYLISKQTSSNGRGRVIRVMSLSIQGQTGIHWGGIMVSMSDRWLFFQPGSRVEVRRFSNRKKAGELDKRGRFFLRRFERLGEMRDIEESIRCHREALKLLPAPHPDRPVLLNNLANALHRQFKQKGDFENLEESIRCHREALELRPAPHPDRSGSLNNLASALFTRFQQKGDFENLEESIWCHREALELWPAPHPNRSGSLNNLASALSTRFQQKGDFENLEESIQCHRETLELRPALHPDRSGSLNNLANALSTWFQQKGDFENLEESIWCHREALELRPAPHPDRSGSLNNLANVLFRRFEKKEEINDLQEAITSYQEALQILPTYHPHHVVSRSLGIALMKLHSITSQPCHLEAAMDAFRVAINAQSSSSLDRFVAGKSWASHAHSSHPSTLDAYQQTMALLPRLATLDLDLQARQEALRHSDSLARNGASCAISAGNFTQAIEFLEEGRGVFWSQSFRLRTPFDHLQSKVPVLATKLRDLSNALEQGSFRNVSRTIDNDQKRRMAMEEEANHFRRLDEDWNHTLKEVRNLDEFRDFLLPKPFHELKRVAINRRIVILNASEHGCDGLILSDDGVTHIPFPTITMEVATALGRLLQLALSPHGTRSPHIPKEIHATLRPLFDELHSRGRLDLQRQWSSCLWHWPRDISAHLGDIVAHYCSSSSFGVRITGEAFARHHLTYWIPVPEVRHASTSLVVSDWSLCLPSHPCSWNLRFYRHITWRCFWLHRIVIYSHTESSSYSFTHTRRHLQLSRCLPWLNTALYHTHLRS